MDEPEPTEALLDLLEVVDRAERVCGPRMPCATPFSRPGAGMLFPCAARRR